VRLSRCIHKWFLSRLQSQLDGTCPACNRAIFNPVVVRKEREPPLIHRLVADNITFTDKCCGRSMFLILGCTAASVVVIAIVYAALLIAKR
jgi:hypothetical protein